SAATERSRPSSPKPTANSPRGSDTGTRSPPTESIPVATGCTSPAANASSPATGPWTASRPILPKYADRPPSTPAPFTRRYSTSCANRRDDPRRRPGGRVDQSGAPASRNLRAPPGARRASAARAAQPPLMPKREPSLGLQPPNLTPNLLRVAPKCRTRSLLTAPRFGSTSQIPRKGGHRSCCAATGDPPSSTYTLKCGR
ncbi:MAG: hypothetical protein JWM71_1098, partial [Solirubrobacteraceae bacterium]|nr:hypothetical protein [Solirubrobacteraceae bacterium]